METSADKTRPATFGGAIAKHFKAESERWLDLREETIKCQADIQKLFLAAEEAKDSGMIAGWIAEWRLIAREWQCRAFQEEKIDIDDSIRYLEGAQENYEFLEKREWVRFWTSRKVCKLMHYHYVKTTGKSATVWAPFFGNGECVIATPQGASSRSFSGMDY